MSWVDVLRRDLRCTFRSRLGPAVAIFVLLCTVGVAGLIAFFADPEYPPPMESMVAIFGSLLSFVVPLVALMASYSAVVGERTTGSVRFLLGLPNSRTDAYAGKFLSRTLLVVVPIVVGTLLAGVVVVPVAENGSFGFFAGLALLAAVYAILFVGVGMTASVVADSDTRAVAIVVGVFTLLRAGWPAFQWAGLQSLQEPHPRPAWYFWLGRVNPMNAFVRLTTDLYPVERHPLITTPYTPPEHVQDRGFAPDLARESMAGTFVVSGEFAAIVLGVTTLVVPLLGWLYFRQRDVL